MKSGEDVRFGADAGASDADPVSVSWPVLASPPGGSVPHELSGGEQQQVGIARALATGNPVLLADEPTGELDFRTGFPFLSCFNVRRSGPAVRVVTHNREISRMVDRVVELSRGRRLPGVRREETAVRAVLVTTFRTHLNLIVRWSWLDLGAHWPKVAAIALVVAIGTGGYADLTSIVEWRKVSYDVNYRDLAICDLQVDPIPGSLLEESTLAALVRDLPHGEDGHRTRRALDRAHPGGRLDRRRRSPTARGDRRIRLHTGVGVVVCPHLPAQRGMDLAGTLRFVE